MRRGCVLLLPVLLILGVGMAAAQPSPTPSETPGMTYDYPHTDPATGAPDPGTPGTDTNGNPTVTYKDGWTKTRERDNSFGPGGTKETVKDQQGKIKEITVKDKAGTVRHHFLIVDNPDGSRSTYSEGYNATGKPTKRSKEVEKDGKKTEYEWDPKAGKYLLATAPGRLTQPATLVMVGGALLLAGLVMSLYTTRSVLCTALAATDGNPSPRSGATVFYLGLVLVAVGVALQTWAILAG